MATTRSRSIEILVRILDEAFVRKAWHGTTLRGSLTSVDATAAVARPAPGRHNIAELAVHAAYWKYAVRRRITGIKRGTFPLKGSNWFTIDALDAPRWRELIELLEREHEALRAAVGALRESALDRKPPNGGIWTLGQLISGAAAHDLYHTGQIQLVKRFVVDR
ncbi:MAG TPA: DinB family protein [Thermoanaerobaculia bacterium]|nr:DinB family protein [Thermoanaerobaculia bacterium]